MVLAEYLVKTTLKLSWTFALPDHWKALRFPNVLRFAGGLVLHLAKKQLHSMSCSMQYMQGSFSFFNFCSLWVQDLCLAKLKSLQIVLAIGSSYSRPFMHSTLASTQSSHFRVNMIKYNIYFMVKHVMHFLKQVFAYIRLIMQPDLLYPRH